MYNNLAVMEWEEILKEKVKQLDVNDLEKLRQLYSTAYAEGRKTERKIAIEAHRLRCIHLFGNRCMHWTFPVNSAEKLCAGNCTYIRRFVFELHKLED